MAERLPKDKPDAVLIIANSVDTAMLAQQLRKRHPRIHISASEWSATERLTELGGKTIEGMAIAQLLDRNSTNLPYVAFRKALVSSTMRKNRDGTAGFDAANVVLDALMAKKGKQSLKQTILERRVFSGSSVGNSF